MKNILTWKRIQTEQNPYYFDKFGFRDTLGFHTEWAGESYVPPKGINQTFGIRNFYVADPEGNLLETGSTSEL